MILALDQIQPFTCKLKAEYIPRYYTINTTYTNTSTTTNADADADADADANANTDHIFNTIY